MEKPTACPTPPINKDSHLAYYAIGLVDVLSQREDLARWAALGPGDLVGDDILQAASDSVRKLLAVRKTLLAHIAGFSDVSPTEGASASQAAQLLPGLADLLSTDVNAQFFSDTVVLYSRLRFVDGLPAIKSLAAMLSGFGLCQLLLLAKGVAIRGAVEIGTAIDAFPGEIYGPGLARAYQLESEAADYPRVLVGPRLLGLLRDCHSGAPQSAVERAVASNASHLLEAIFMDDDGMAAIDFMGTFFAESTTHLSADHDREVMRGQAVAAMQFVEREHNRFCEAGNVKLARRYARLRRYMELRKAIWNE